LIVDRRESALNEAGDYVIAAAEGAFGPEHIRAELGEILIGKHPGRTSNDEITVSSHSAWRLRISRRLHMSTRKREYSRPGRGLSLVKERK
jgi:hypothetical protein